MNNKFHAKRTWSNLCNRMFASRAECRRGEELRCLEMYGAITNLEYQPKFVLATEPYRVTYSADFKFTDEDGKTVYEDCKGVLTRDCRTKIAWLYQLKGIEVKLIK